MKDNVFKSIRNASIAVLILLGVYVIVVSFVSGWDFMLEQLSKYWYYIGLLSFGFGIQIGLYSYLKNIINQQRVSPNVVTLSATTSTAAMISCCAHYLVNILPILGTVGIITIISQYQIQLFWVGLTFNFIGILYMLNKVYKFSKSI